MVNAKASARQATLFCAVGFSNLLVDVAVYYTTYHFFHFNYLIAQAVSYPCGAINSYMLNRKLTFQEKGPASLFEVMRFAILNAVSIVASILALFLTNHVGKLDLTLSKMAANGCAMCINFTGSKLWVFRGNIKRRKQPPTTELPVADLFELRVDPPLRQTGDDVH